MIEGISAVTLGTHEMPRAVRFYCALGFKSCVATNNRHSPLFERG
jgi:catechol 2,3-dioxygenase-like lactoylglutathione lyase family enzyme